MQVNFAEILKSSFNTFTEDKHMRPATFVEIVNITAIQNRGKKDEKSYSYALCDYLTKVVFANYLDEDTNTYDVNMDFVTSSGKTAEFEKQEDAQRFYDALKAHMMGKSESSSFDIKAYNGR